MAGNYPKCGILWQKHLICANFLLLDSTQRRTAGRGGTTKMMERVSQQPGGVGAHAEVKGMAQVDEASCPGADPGQPCIFKLVLLGTDSVGKSSLALRYVKNDFKSILPTVGCAFFTKVVDLGAASLNFEIWDTAGQEKYHSVCHLYFRGASAALLVYDVTRKDSFCKAQQWLKDLEEEFHPGEVVIMLVGNKTDLGKEREVTLEEGKEFAESKGLLFMETSAKLNHQVTEVFNAVGLAQRLPAPESRPGPSPVPTCALPPEEVLMQQEFSPGRRLASTLPLASLWLGDLRLRGLDQLCLLQLASQHGPTCLDVEQGQLGPGVLRACSVS
ncbi:ras-related protein Rab-17-like protein [Camelus ferus]|nr:ras-related protein Rab-17-like protein [Camelus ferus]